MIKFVKFIIFSLFMLIMPSLAGAEQYLIFSEQCKAGDEEAQKLFKQAQDKRFGRGMIVNLEEAIKLYNQAAEKGSIRALYDLGTLYEQRPVEGVDANGQEKAVLEYYTQASAAGCPEGTYKLHLWAEHQAENLKQNATGENATGQNATGQNATGQNATGQNATGQNAMGQNAMGQNATVPSSSVPNSPAPNISGPNISGQSPSNPDKFLVEAANGGALVAMFELGRQLVRLGNLQEGTAWLQRALDLGYGDAADTLSRMQLEQKNMREGIRLLRQGASLGSIACLHRLSWIYSRGQYNQMRDPEYAKCFTEILKTINHEAPPELVPDFDELCPPRRVFTY